MKNDNLSTLCLEKKVTYIYNLSERNVFNALVNLKQLTFELTDACNLQCRYCGYGAFYNTHDKRENKYLNFDIAKQMIDYLYKIWSTYKGTSKPRKIVFGFYGGEPLLNMNLIKQIIEYLESLPVIPDTLYKYNMTTNAMLLDKHMDYLAEKNVTLLLSLDGDEYAQSYRVDHNEKNSFHRVIYNIRLLKKTYPDYFAKYISFNSVLHDRNNVKYVRKFIFENFGSYPQVSELNTFGICESMKEEFNKIFHNIRDDISTSDKSFVDSSPDTMELFRFVRGMTANCYFTYNALLKKFSNLSFPTGTCLPFEKKIFVTVNGNILPCERIDQKYVLGHVTSEKVDLDLKAIAKLYSSYYRKTQHLCKGCYMKPFCTQCLFYMKNLLKDVECPGFTNRQNIVKYINYYSNILRSHPELYKKVSTELLLQL